MPIVVLVATFLVHPGNAGLTTGRHKGAPDNVKLQTFKGDAIMRFTRSVYDDLGAFDNVTQTVDKFRDRFLSLNETSDGMVGRVLDTLFELKMLDLQQSIRRAKQMHAVLNNLKASKLVNDGSFK